MESNHPEKMIETDVLVLGGGAAGCAAAMGAREQGARVCILDKGTIESCGCAGAGNANYHTHLNTGPDWDTADAMTRFSSGTANKTEFGGLSSNIFHRTVTRQLIPMLKRLEKIGIEFFKDEDGVYRRTQAFGDPGPWVTTMKNGRFFKRLLAKEVRRMGVETLDHTMVIGLLGNGNRVSGAVGFHRDTGAFHLVKAKKTVLALGNSQRRMTTNSTGNPFNIQRYPYNTGSQIVLAYEAGAKVVSLELGNATMIPKGFGAPGMCAFVGMGAYLRNAMGERYMERCHPMAERAPRSDLVLASNNERLQGRGPLFIDARHLSDEERLHMVEDRLFCDWDTYRSYFAQNKLDLKRQMIETELGDLGGGGSLLINEHCESTLHGLYSHPANTLSFALCGGYSAGSEAGRALKEQTIPGPDAASVADQKERTYLPLKAHSGCSWRQFEGMIRQVMGYYMGYVRNEKGMETAYRALRRIEDENRISADNVHELMRAHEAIHLLTYCQLLVQSALQRKESGRSFYKRMDYPGLDEEWKNRHVVLWQEEGRPKWCLETIT